MARYLTPPGSEEVPTLDPDAVSAFFNSRANRLEEVGPLKAVIYQDKGGDLAVRRDLAEVDCIMPLLKLDGRQRFLDIGCGTGRWTKRAAPLVLTYHGIDFNERFLSHARASHAKDTHCRFTCIGADGISESALRESGFDRMLCAGVSIYLNDCQLLKMFEGMSEVAASTCRIVFREPVGIGQRLTLTGHYSDELEHEYHAIYRTESELLAAMQGMLVNSGFALIDSGDVFVDKELNNRSETGQRWFLLERCT